MAKTKPKSKSKPMALHAASSPPACLSRSKLARTSPALRLSRVAISAREKS